MPLVSRATATAWYTEEDSNSKEPVTYVANLSTSEISVLTGPSESIWLELETPQSLDELIDKLAQLYNQNPTDIADDVKIFVEQLQSMQLLNE